MLFELVSVLLQNLSYFIIDASPLEDDVAVFCKNVICASSDCSEPQESDIDFSHTVPPVIHSYITTK